MSREKHQFAALHRGGWGKLGVGIRLYFDISYTYAILLLVGGVIAIPSLVLYASGNGIAYGEHVDALELAVLTPGMFNPSYVEIESIAQAHAKQNISTSTAQPLTLDQYSMLRLQQQTVRFGFIDMSRSDAASMVSVLDVLISLIFMFAFPFCNIAFVL